MRRDLLEIVKTFISLSSEYYEDKIVESLELLKSEWPNLTIDEIREMDAIIRAYKKSVLGEDEEDVKEDESKVEEKKNYDFDNEPKGLIRGFFRRDN